MWSVQGTQAFSADQQEWQDFAQSLTKGRPRSPMSRQVRLCACHTQCSCSRAAWQSQQLLPPSVRIAYFLCVRGHPLDSQYGNCFRCLQTTLLQRVEGKSLILCQGYLDASLAYQQLGTDKATVFLLQQRILSTSRARYAKWIIHNSK